VSSATNSFKDIVPGLTVTLAGAATEAVTVTVAQTSNSIVGAVQLFVDQYNKLRDKLDTYDAFNPQDGTTGTLFGSTESVQLDSQLSQTISATYFNDGTIRSLAELGVDIDDQGKLSFDKSVFQDRFDDDPAGITEFFTDDTPGFAVKTDTLLESLVGKDNSLLVNRIDSLQKQVDNYSADIDNWNTRLDKIQEQLRNEFFTMESIVSSIKSNLSAISQIQYIAPVNSTTRSS